MSKRELPGQYLRVGDLVLCNRNAATDAFGVAGRVGLILELRKAHAHVFYADRAESFWLPRHALPRLRADDVASRALPFVLSRVLLLLEAEECEILSLGAPAHMIQVAHDQITIVTLDRVRELLGSAVVEMLLTPAGRHRIETTVALDPAAFEPLA
ncbi:MAG: hypothetical protein U1E76_21075 [Planctomycetota bacterium]